MSQKMSSYDANADTISLLCIISYLIIIKYRIFILIHLFVCNKLSLCLCVWARVYVKYYFTCTQFICSKLIKLLYNSVYAISRNDDACIMKRTNFHSNQFYASTAVESFQKFVVSRLQILIINKYNGKEFRENDE